MVQRKTGTRRHGTFAACVRDVTRCPRARGDEKSVICKALYCWGGDRADSCPAPVCAHAAQGVFVCGVTAAASSCRNGGGLRTTGFKDLKLKSQRISCHHPRPRMSFASRPMCSLTSTHMQLKGHLAYAMVRVPTHRALGKYARAWTTAAEPRRARLPPYCPPPRP